MRRKDESKKPIIVNYINDFFYEHDKVPTVREIVNGTGIPLSTVHRYLLDMQEKGELSYNGYRSARTKEMSEVAPIHGIAVLGTVACGPGQEEEQRFVEMIRMPESLVEKGDYFALIAKGESMIGAGIFPGDYVFVKRQQTANEGDLVIALFEGKNNLKKLGFDPKKKKYILHSCNPDTKAYPDIIVDKCLCGYKPFFDLFVDFKGYVDYFHMQDLVTKNYSAVEFLCWFDGFNSTFPLPRTVEEYTDYLKRVIQFSKARNARIEVWCKQNSR